MSVERKIENCHFNRMQDVNVIDYAQGCLFMPNMTRYEYCKSKNRKEINVHMVIRDDEVFEPVFKQQPFHELKKYRTK